MAKNAEQWFDGKRFSRYDGNNYFWWKVSSARFGKYVSGTSVSMHRYVWEHTNGKIPEGYSIHHIDHDPENNALTNLELVETKEHARRHAMHRVANDREWFGKFVTAGVQASKEWHASSEGREWHSQHAKETMHTVEANGVELTCVWCGRLYMGLSAKRKRGFCSNSCQGMARKHSGVDDIARKCAVCGGEFTTNKYGKRATCSRSCANEAVSRARKNSARIQS